MTKQKATRPERLILQFPTTEEELKRLDAAIARQHTVDGEQVSLSRASLAHAFFLGGLVRDEKAAGK